MQTRSLGLANKSSFEPTIRANIWKATGYVDGLGRLEAWGTSLPAALEALQALAAQRVAEWIMCRRIGVVIQLRRPE